MLNRYKITPSMPPTRAPNTSVSRARAASWLKRTVHEKIQIPGREAGLGSHIHPHMLRHSCGYHLIAQGLDIRRVQAFLGHKDIKNTQIYTEVTSHQLEDIEW